MAAIELKCHPEPFQAILDGRKTFEWRRDDAPHQERPFEVDDRLRIREWIPCEICGGTGETPEFLARWCEPCNRNGGEYTGRQTMRQVLYTLRDRFDIPTGYVVMSISPREVRATKMCNPCLMHRHTDCTAAPEGDCGCHECYVDANRTVGLEGSA